MGTNTSSRDYSRIKVGLVIEVFENNFGWFRARVEEIENRGFYVRGLEYPREGARGGFVFESPYWRFIDSDLDIKDIKIQELEKEVKELKEKLGSIVLT